MMHAANKSILLFDPKDGGDMFLRNVRRHSPNYTALYPKDRTLHNHRCEHLKSCMCVCWVGRGVKKFLEKQCEVEVGGAILFEFFVA
jgi:hypothetical protein